MTLATTLRDNKAVYTIAGAGDLAVEKIREMPEQVVKARETAVKYQQDVRELLERYRGQFREAVERYRGEVRDNVGRVQERIEVTDLPNAAVAYMTHGASRAVEFIDELAERGKRVVHREAAAVAEITEADAKPATRARGTRRTTQSRAAAASSRKGGV
ncbi:hypothetical protein Acsp04_48360 [Actinomadura sp. NBRC 104425]|uniref:hypothetical protein n=1 Tax=Actinomadura sp. NBRC 104425 TaxID=3032204 RepID=UPI0024A30972|nr:hypothetical protein [Actinomadura sp. NBRC 104425]GLZ14601.1 hypothetical protein Acsp04_48360 [Actinomadura sp. NBRC 104425]